MEKFIKYKRIQKEVNDISLQQLFNELITEGWEIIYYKEEIHVDVRQNILCVVIVAGKKQSDIL